MAGRGGQKRGQQLLQDLEMCGDCPRHRTTTTTFNCSLSPKLPPHKFANSTVSVSSPSYWRRSHEREIEAAGDEPSRRKLSIDRHKLALGLI